MQEEFEYPEGLEELDIQQRSWVKKWKELAACERLDRGLPDCMRIRLDMDSIAGAMQAQSYSPNSESDTRTYDTKKKKEKETTVGNSTRTRKAS